jgi:uncharacterized protein DUF2844
MLGGDASTIEADHVQLKASVKVARAQRYTVHELTTPSGTVVREYVAPSGKVFAVAWSGPLMPDLRQLLGPHFEALEKRAAKRGTRGPTEIVQPGLVVRSSGHMRAFAGSAYLPGEMPQGVVPDQLR